MVNFEGYRASVLAFFRWVAAVLVLICATGTASGQEHPVVDAKGLQKNRDYFSQLPFEHIDTATGSLVLTFTDLVLPGPGGRDVKFQRTYNSKDDRWTFGLAGYPLYVTVLPLPAVGATSEGVLISMPTVTGSDGAVHRTNPVEPIDTTSIPRIEQTLNMSTTDRFWRYGRSQKELYLPDGTTCTYEDAPSAWPPNWKRLKTCVAPHGSQELSIEWGESTIVTQKIGDQTRSVTITLNQDRRPTALTFMGKTWMYEWGTTTRVVPPVGPSWEFNRPASQMPVTFVVKTPQGGQIHYLLENQEFPQWSTPEVTVYSLVVAKRSMLDRDQTTGPEWVYTYGNRSADGSTIVDTPTGSQIKYRHDPEDARILQRDVLVLESGQWVPVDQETLTYTSLPVVEWQTNPCSGCFQLATQSKAINSRQVMRHGRTYTTQYHYLSTNFADYHHPWQVVESGDNVAIPRATVRQYRHFDEAGRLNVGHVSREQVTINAQTFVREWDVNASNSTINSQTIYGVTTTFGGFFLGQPGSAQDANGKVTTFQYEWGVPNRIVTPHHVITREVNPEGTIKSETEAAETPNARTTTYEYDSALRLEKIIPAQPVGGRNSTITEHDNIGGTWLSTTRGSSVVKTTIDGFGRPVLTKTGTGATAVEVTTRYDAAGRKIHEGYPVPAGSSSIGTDIDYDALGRVVKRTNPGGSSSVITYAAGTVTIVDEKQRSIIRRVEAFGDPDETRLVGLTDAAGKNWSYQYNTLGKLTKVIAPDGKERTWTYDPTKAWLLSETHPESGTTTYGYLGDLVGNVKTKTDAKGQTIAYDYDGNNRVKKMTAVGEVTEITDITYELGSDNRETAKIGPLDITYFYDKAGRPEGYRALIDGRPPFDVRYDMDANDNLRGVLYPSLRRVRYGFDSENRITSVSDILSGVSYASSMSYHPSGAVTSYTAGNNIAFSFTYDPQRYWPTGITAGPLGLTYPNYDNVGNVLAIDDSRGASWNQTFDYDFLDRLTVSNGSYGSIGYTYDDHGNMQTQGPDVFAYDPATLRLATRNGQTIGYDNNGSVTSGIQGTFAYTPRNQMRSATVNGATTTYEYDSDEWRLVKRTPTSTTYYLRGPGGQLLTEMTVEGSAAPKYRDYIYAGSRLLAVVER